MQKRKIAQAAHYAAQMDKDKTELNSKTPKQLLSFV